MKKIISLFKRDYEKTKLIYDEVVEGAEWVINGEGFSTRKWDGTACLIKDGKLFKRYDAKHGKTPPEGFIAAQEPDSVTGHWPGWIEVDFEKPENKYFKEGWDNTSSIFKNISTTYELIGPKINGNAEKNANHVLIPHNHEISPFYLGEISFFALKNWFIGRDVEGIVWHHPDGRMVKIKKKDFGMKRGD